MANLYRIKNDVAEANLEGSLALLSISDNTYFMLNEVGAMIWESLKKGMKVQDIVEQIVSTFEVDVNLCRNDVEDLLNDLQKADLLTFERVNGS